MNNTFQMATRGLRRSFLIPAFTLETVLCTSAGSAAAPSTTVSGNLVGKAGSEALRSGKLQAGHPDKMFNDPVPTDPAVLRPVSTSDSHIGATFADTKAASQASRPIWR